MKSTYNYSVIKIAAIIVLMIIAPVICLADTQAGLFLDNFENNDKQLVSIYQVDSLYINRLGAEIILGRGMITVFDFGLSRPSAMVYKGRGRFLYTPPDNVEAGQLMKFTDKTAINSTFERAAFFFTMSESELRLPSGANRVEVGHETWKSLTEASKSAFEHLDLYLPNEMLGDLLSDTSGLFFYADMELDDIGHAVFREDPIRDDRFRVYQLKRIAGELSADILGGFTIGNSLPSERGVRPIDIYHYDIDSKIETEGKMIVNCRIHFVPLIDGRKFLYFDWYYRNKIISAVDSRGQAILPVYKKERLSILSQRRQEAGLGLVLNEPLVAGDSDYIDIQIDCKCLEKHGTLYFIKSPSGWYPHSNFRDLATYSLTYDCPDKYEVISCGVNVQSKIENGRLLSRFELDKPYEYVIFNVGSFKKKEMKAGGFPPVEVYLAGEIADVSAAEFEAYLSEQPESQDNISVIDTSHAYLANIDRLGMAGADVLNSLAFYTSTFGSCPFDTIKAASIPYGGLGVGAPGLIYLSWDSFLNEDLNGLDEQFRAHEVAHQWWGPIVDNESYRDTWIIEGLAGYCGLWYYQMSARNEGAYNKMLKDNRQKIISGLGLRENEKVVGLETLPSGTGQRSEGSKAGPIVLGYRLNSSKSLDYIPIVYYKGAYIFHMIRYLFHDYKTASDDRFAIFLKDLLAKYNNEPITTDDLKELLEVHLGGEMDWFFNQWVYGTSVPKYIFSYISSPNKDGQYAVKCQVEQKDVPPDFKMLVPITVLFESDRFIHFKAWVDQPQTTIDLPLLPYKPTNVIFNTYDAVLGEVEYK